MLTLQYTFHSSDGKNEIMKNTIKKMGMVKNTKPKQTFKLPSKFSQKKISNKHNSISLSSHMEVEVKELFDRLNFQDHTEHIPDIKNKIPFVRFGENLPTNIQKSLNQYTTNELIISGGCYLNSSHLSLLNSDIKIVQGYYGQKLSKTEKSEIIKIIVTNKIRKNKFGMYELWSPYGRTFVLLERGIVIDPHSWNYIDGVHFDVTRQFDSKLKSDWVYYFPHRIVDISTINSDMKSILIQSLKEFKIRGVVMYQRTVMNLAS